jgi:amino-acid N-acetyltransferase
MIIKREAGFIVRQAKARDVEKIFQLIRANSNQGIMLPRSRSKIFSRLQGAIVAEDDHQEIIGCGVLTILWGDLAEVQSLVIAPHMRGKGLGRKIVEALIEKAAALDIPKVLALTYQVEFFSKLGFTIIDKDSIPRKIWGECLECPKLEECDETAMLYHFKKT